MWFNGTLRSTGARELAGEPRRSNKNDTEALSSLEEVFTLECVLKNFN